ncbi:MAG: dockerin type I domain-containing protein, partial [Pirellulaceae bacterium]|nr:dockerin type I domain-containing protein [Pirellulaceae bacterium]
EWVPEAWRQTFPAGGDGAHRVAPPIQGDFGQTAAPNFGNSLIQVIQFITPLSVLRPDAALADHRFIRPADDPLTAWQGLNPALLLQDYRDALAPWQSYPIQNASAGTLRYTVTFERQVQPPGDGFLVITDEQLNPLVGDTVTIDIHAGQTRRFFLFYDQPEMAPGDQVLRTYPDWYNQPETAVNEALTPAHTFARDDHLLVVTEIRDMLGTIQGGSNSYVRLVGASTFDSDLTYDGFVFTADAQRFSQLAAFSPIVPGDPRWDPTSDINVRFANGAATMPEIGFGDYGALNVEFRRARNPFLDLDGSAEAIGVDYVTQYQAGDDPVAVADSTADFANFGFLLLQSVDLRIVHRPDGTNERLLLDAPGVRIEDGGARVIIDRTLERQSIADFQPLLSQVRYENTSPTPTPGPRTIVIVAYGRDSTDGISEFCYTWSEADSETVPASCGVSDSVDARTGNTARTTVFVEAGTSVPGGVLALAAGAPAMLTAADSAVAPSASAPLLPSLALPAGLPACSADAGSRKTELTLQPADATVPPPGPEGENELAFGATPIEDSDGMSKTQRTQGRDVTPLRVEQLEDRRLLAQYAFAINLYADRGGAPGELIADDRIQAGEAFFVEITAEDLRTEPQGLEGLGLRVQWDPQVLEEIDSLFDPSAPGSAVVTAKFPLFRSGWLDNRAGSIDLLHGMAFSSLGAGQVIGLEGPERFALLHFRAEQTAQDSPITIRPRGVGFVPMREYTSEDLVFESQTISVLEASSSLVTLDPSEPVEITAPPEESPDETSEATLTDEPGDASGGEQEDALAPPTPPRDEPDHDPQVSLPDQAAASSDDGQVEATAGSEPSATWQNPLQPCDVDGVNGVTPLDALITINYLNEHAGDAALPPLAADPPPFYYDVNGDNLCTPHDALLVINFLKSAQTDSAEGEAEPAVEQRSPAAASFIDVPPLARLDSSALPPANAPVVPSADPRRAPVLPWIADDELDDTIDTLARAPSGDDAFAADDLHGLLFADLARALD